MRYPFHGVNNGEGEFIPQHNGSNSQFENSNKRSRISEVNLNPQKSTPLTFPSQRPNAPHVPMNRGTTHIFYKTRMCQKFLDGMCRNGDNCTFAHGPKDLREPPPNWQEYVRDNNNKVVNGNCNWNDDQKIIHQMRICRKFYNGDECPYGDKCNFLHESPAKFKNETRESSMIHIQPVVDRGQTRPEFRQASVSIAHEVAEINTPVARADGVVQPYVGSSVATNVVHGPITKPPVITDCATDVGVQRGVGRGFSKLKGKKVKRIYGDWINDEEDELN
ncbi:zinc finger CCCH domain-containing protein 39-like [Rutidosis leptorrhynchoides]|uniref:zinc finger CCCH domain-containing protein 39-like n=1 Tax=Rutidosis leptorrhynchoides TaxID=125765 RepID=UPI003A9A36B7